MAKKDKKYNKLPGSKKGFLFGKYTLWQDADHLLHIFSRFGVEDYKRFYYSDIQAIITRKTVAGKVHNIIMGCFSLLFLAPFFAFDGPWSIFYLIVSGIMFFIMLINLYLGPTCETRLMTAVQTEKLQSLNRLKKTFRVMDSLRPHIQQAQGSLSREDLMKIPPQPAGRAAPQRSGPSAASQRDAVKHEDGRFHMILFVLLLTDAVLVASEFFLLHVVPTVLSSLASLCVGIFVIVALVRQHNSDLPGSLRTLTWTTLGLVGATFVMGYVVGMVFAFENPALAYNQWEIVKSISSLSPWDSALKMGYNILVISGALFLGLPGLIMLKQNQSGSKQRPATMPAASRHAKISKTLETG
jgi:hypothetical protein